ncbi:MAG: ABC transporter ATP-binding protein [Clostridia bacterium]|nr:ABC transporter ATP-binding protein [Clostridia bacterium]
MSSLKLTSVNKIFPSGVPALTDINFEMDDHEFIVVVGQEKSGKSTLVRTICGLEDSSSGTIEMDGKDITGSEPKTRDMAVVFRGDSLFPGDTIFDNLGYGLKVRKAPQTLIEEKVKVVSQVLGITDLLYKKPKNLTAAEKLKVSMGRALVREPRIYLFDEPLNGLDSKLRADMLNLIINLQVRTKGSFIYATRNLQDALAIGTRLVVMREGFIQQIDTPANLYDYPANTYVAFYIGEPTMNLIFGAQLVSTEDGGVAVKGDFGSIPVSAKTKARIENLKDYLDKGRKVVLGIRPEDTQIVEEGGYFSGKVSENNYAGNAIYTEINAGRSVLLVKFKEVGTDWNGDITDGTPVKDHDVQVKADTDHLYLFDGETRLTILAKDEGYQKTSHKDADRMPKSYLEEREILKELAPKKKKKK